MVPSASLPFLLLLLPLFSHACLPGLGWGYNPYNPLAGIGGLGVGVPGMGLGYPGIGYPRLGPFRSQANHDQIRNPAVLNCPSLDEACRWSNTNEEEMDWVSAKTVPDAQRWYSTLLSSVYPDAGAGALISSQRRGWEGGQLVSDMLPCVSPGIRLTATAWKSKLGPIELQPKLQVCTKNTNEVRFPLVNCAEMDIRNGVPMTVNVPVPNDPSAPAQIVLYGNNFAAPEGGALFVQDIRLDGNLDCVRGRNPDSHPTLVDPLPMPHVGGNVAEDRPGVAPQPAAMPNYSTMDRNTIDVADVPSNPFKGLAGNSLAELDVPPPASPTVPSETPSGLFETCLAISCDATDYLNCNFWRSSGGNQWEIATSKRVANPKTSITSSPGGAERFLVAPFTNAKEDQFTLVSEAVSIPHTQEVYFCFYELLTSKSFSLAICTDGNECFYKKSALDDVESTPEWKVRCTKLPPGNYELRVHAENHGSEQGELGFLPVRLAKDPLAQQLLC